MSERRDQVDLKPNLIDPHFLFPLDNVNYVWYSVNLSMVDSRKYLVVFFITGLIFGTAIIASNLLGDKKVEDVRAIENRVALDILSSETQFALLAETSCRDIGPGFLSKELGPLGEKLSYAENQGEFNNVLDLFNRDVPANPLPLFDKSRGNFCNLSRFHRIKLLSGRCRFQNCPIDTFFVKRNFLSVSFDDFQRGHRGGLPSLNKLKLTSVVSFDEPRGKLSVSYLPAGT